MDGRSKNGVGGSPVVRIIGYIGIIALGIILCGSACSENAKQTTVAEFSAQLEKKINEELESRHNTIRKFVEDSHGTVDVRYAYVSGLKVETKDGSNNVGKDGQNIRRIRIEITTKWDGIFHKGGNTVVGILLENVNGELKAEEQEIISTDALINLRDTKFWFDTGWLIGTLIAIL